MKIIDIKEVEGKDPERRGRFKRYKTDTGEDLGGGKGESKDQRLTYWCVGHEDDTAVSPCSTYVRETDASVSSSSFNDSPSWLQPSTLSVTQTTLQPKYRSERYSQTPLLCILNDP